MRGKAKQEGVGKAKRKRVVKELTCDHERADYVDAYFNNLELDGLALGDLGVSLAGMIQQLPDSLGDVARYIHNKYKTFVGGESMFPSGDLLPLPLLYLSAEDMGDLYNEIGQGRHRGDGSWLKTD